MTHKEYKEKMERGIAQVRAGQAITKTMKELERMAEDEMRVAQLPPPRTAIEVLPDIHSPVEKSVENRRNGPFAPACGPGGFNIQCPLSFPKIIL